PARSSVTGGPTATSRTIRRSASTTRTRRSPSSSPTRCTAPSRRSTATCTSAIARTIASRRSRSKASSCTKSRSTTQHPETATRGDGSTSDSAFWKDPQQKSLDRADGANEKIHVSDRVSLTELASFGDGGRQPGQFYAVHSIATDSKGNIYTTETYRGQRLQKFVYKGLAPVSKQNQGTVWATKTTTH